MDDLAKLAQLVRYYILTSTTTAGSGHPSSSLSAVEVLVSLYFGGHFRAHLNDPSYPTNDRLVISKGHAAPLLYSLYAAAGVIEESELATLRQFGSRLQGHPTPLFPGVAVATGSLGQGLADAAGLVFNDQKLGQLTNRTFVLLGDSELAEGSNWEAMALAARLGLSQLVGIVDMNGLGQRGETMYAHDSERLARMVESFGWEVLIVDGHDFAALEAAWKKALVPSQQPVMIIAETVKGKGVSFIENQPGWHGRALNQEELAKALVELGTVDRQIRGVVASPIEATQPVTYEHHPLQLPRYEVGTAVATRQAVGEAVAALAVADESVVALDAEVGNSTHFEAVLKVAPERYIETYIAEQTMVGMATGLAVAGKIPFMATFAAFLTRAYDQLRMARYSQAALKVVGTHAGISIGPDGASQMALEDIAMMRSVGATVLYPADANAAAACVELAYHQPGMVYIRATRAATRVMDISEPLVVGGSRTLRQSSDDSVTLIAAGITLYEALKAADRLQDAGIAARVIDLYSIQPLDVETVQQAANETSLLVTVEDHGLAGGLGEAVASALTDRATPLIHLAVMVEPQSGQPEDLLAYAKIDAAAIVETVTKHLTGAS